MDPLPKHNVDGRKQTTEKHMQYDSNYMKSKKQISVFVKDTYQVVTKKKKKTIETSE